MLKNCLTKKISYLSLSLLCLFFAACQTEYDAPRISEQKGQTQEVEQPAINLVKQANSPQGQILPISAQAIIKQKTIDLEVAQTPQQQSQGLMFREELPANRGMFFPFAEAKLTSFWMYQVPVALDMVFLKQSEKSDQARNNDSIRQVVAIADSVPPCKVKPQDCPVYGPDTFVDGVIELKAGRAKELGLQKGDSVKIRFLDPVE